ncbi:MAG: hypothetical protein U0802_10785 [Candidatus Binatia bacterium]
MQVLSQPSPSRALPSSHSSPGFGTPLPQSTGVGVSVGVSVGVTVAVGVLVTVDVTVGVSVSVMVAVGISVPVAVMLGVRVTVGVDVTVAVSVTVGVAVSVAVGVAVCVGVRVTVGVAVAVKIGVHTAPVQPRSGSHAWQGLQVTLALTQPPALALGFIGSQVLVVHRLPSLQSASDWHWLTATVIEHEACRLALSVAVNDRTCVVPASPPPVVHAKALLTGLAVVGNPGVSVAPLGRPTAFIVTFWPKSLSEAWTVKLTL